MTSREQLIRDHMGLAKALAFRFAGADQDILSVAYVGLVHAANAYRPGGRAKFSTFATFRIRGEILDHFRKHGSLNRSDAKLRERLSRVRGVFVREHRRLPSESELAELMGLSVLELRKARLRFHHAESYSLEAILENPESAPISSLADDRAERALESVLDHAEIVALLRRLPPREALITLLRARGWTHIAIGKRLGVTESRIAQLHARALKQLAGGLDEAA